MVHDKRDFRAKIRDEEVPWEEKVEIMQDQILWVIEENSHDPLNPRQICEFVSNMTRWTREDPPFYDPISVSGLFLRPMCNCPPFSKVFWSDQESIYERNERRAEERRRDSERYRPVTPSIAPSSPLEGNLVRLVEV